MKKTLYVLPIIFLFSCSNLDNKCIDKDIGFISEYNYRDIKNICNYNDKLTNYVYYDNIFNSYNFYEVSKISLDLGEEIMDFLVKNNIILNIGEVEKIQLYYILKDLYNYQDKKIEEDIGIRIDNKFKNYDLELDRLILGENLLTQIFDDTAEYLEGGKKPEPGYLTKQEIYFLSDIFELDVTKYDSINLVTENRGAYNSLDDEGKVLFIKMLEIVNKNSSNISTKSTISNFLSKHKNVE